MEQLLCILSIDSKVWNYLMFVYGIMFCGGEGKFVKIFCVQEKMSRSITGVHKCESSRKFQILPLAWLYIVEVLCFISQYQRNSQQNFAIHRHNIGNKFDLHTATAMPFYVREL